MKNRRSRDKNRQERYSKEKLEGMARGSGFTPDEILKLVKKYMPEALKELEVA
jgi:hypothetical protein